MYSAWKKEDDPPARVEPVPMAILLRAAELAGPTLRDEATMDCIWIAFYFLLRPGEYSNATGDAEHPFKLKMVIHTYNHFAIQNKNNAVHETVQNSDISTNQLVKELKLEGNVDSFVDFRDFVDQKCMESLDHMYGELAGLTSPIINQKTLSEITDMFKSTLFK